VTKRSSQRSEYIDLSNDGRVVLFRRNNLKSPKWQVRIRVPNSSGYRVQSTKTTDRREAERFALDLYEDLYIHVKQGGALVSPKIKTVIDEWITQLEAIGKGNKGGDITQTIATIRNYFYRYVQDARCDEINALLIRYWSWRSENYITRKPSIGTLRREVNALKTFLNYALQRRHINEYTIPNPPSESRRPNQRPTFTIDEWRRIYKSAPKWIASGDSTGHSAARQVAYRYFMVLANSGIRVGEARDLRWEDLQFLESDNDIQIIATVGGKTGVRDVVFQPNTEIHIKDLWNIYKQWQKIDKDSNDQHNEIVYVFMNRQFKRVGSFKKSFNSLLEFAKVKINNGTGNRTIYSLRHFYATMRLSNNVSPFILAKQMGTSVEMLEKYYGQVVTKDLAKQITNISSKKINRRKILTD
jgi:integrase